ncbi:unnamed protein product [Miscanthus lutarioriparius]|uniref:Gnk2-homologous domain-containing protein n=1 Tax=Miscanthus lutarioriparius TaxID=422564 RepID=A0A811Q029_9POAL|nr:unnamed protein product [Miscanthus lutarioriparius]
MPLSPVEPSATTAPSRAFCFGERRGSSASDCLKCLAAAAQDVADGCHGRRGAVWRAGYFLSYADTNASTAREDAWCGWFYDDDSDDTLTAALGTCVAIRDRGGVNESAQVVPALKEGRQLSLSTATWWWSSATPATCASRYPLQRYGDRCG